jgi:hypothetical protein
MGTAFNQVLIHYLDAAGRQATNFFTLADQDDEDMPTVVSSLAASIQAISDAKVTAVQYQVTHHMSGAFGGGPYATVMDRAALLGVIGSSTVGYDIVAPKADIWLPGNKKLDLEHPAVFELIEDMKAALGNSAGVPLSAIKRGTRQWASTRS